MIRSLICLIRKKYTGAWNFFGNSRYIQGYGYYGECLSPMRWKWHDHALNSRQFYRLEKIMSPASSLVKIRLLVGWCGDWGEGGGGKISCVERIYGAKEHVELSTKVRLARRSPPLSLLSYCIVSMPRCAVLEQVFFPLIRPSPFYTGSLLALSSLFLSLCSSLSFRATRPFTLVRSLPTLTALPNYRSSS